MSTLWTTADDVAADFEVSRARHPFFPISALLKALESDPVDLELAVTAVTPESAPNWDFDYWSRGLAGCVLLSRVESAAYVEDVVYALLIEASYEPVPGVPGTAPGFYVSVVWRPELDGWRVAWIGERRTPQQLRRVRTSRGIVPDIIRTDRIATAPEQGEPA